MKSPAFMTSFKFGLFYAVLAIIINLKVHHFLPVWVVAQGFWAAGSIYGVAYMQKNDLASSGGWLRVLFWSNTVMWLVPPLGLFGAGAARVINTRNQGADHGLFRGLINFCYIASLVIATILTNLLLQHWHKG